LATPAICAAACAAAAGVGAGHQHMHFATAGTAAVTVLRVAPLIDALSCSAMTSAAMSDHLGFVLELGHQRGHVGHLDAGAALGRLG
jgi:hypothetical protein